MIKDVVNPNIENWELVKLGDILVKIIGGGTPSKNKPEYWSGNIPWLTIKDMRTRRPIDTKDHITEQAIQESATNLIPPDTVIIATRIGLGKVVRVPYATTINQDLKALITPDYLDKGYLEYWFMHKSQYLGSIGSGTTVKGIRLEQIKELDFPLAPLDQQKRIVAKIEELFSHIDAGIASLQQAKKLLAQYRQSILKAAVTGELTKEWREQNKDKLEPASKLLERILKERRQKWEEQQLAQFKAKGKTPQNDKWKEKYKEVIASDTNSFTPLEWVQVNWETVLDPEDPAPFKRGPFGSALKKAFFVESGYKVYEQYCPINDDCSYERYYITEEKFKELESFSVKDGDFLISCSGVTLGRITQVPKNYKKGVINQALLRVRINRSILDDDYFKLFFRSPYFQSKIFENVSGVAIPNVKGVKDLKAIPVPLPGKEEQIEILRIANSLLSEVERENGQIEKMLISCKSCKQSILLSAFSGKLDL